MIPDNQYKMIDFIIKVSFYSLNQKEIKILVESTFFQYF